MGVLWGVFSVCYSIIIMVVFTQVGGGVDRPDGELKWLVFRMSGLVMEISQRILVILVCGVY